MKKLFRIGLTLMAISVVSALDLGSSSFVSRAEARVGRPLTPYSVAGVARRTYRRCAAGVYHCY